MTNKKIYLFSMWFLTAIVSAFTLVGCSEDKSNGGSGDYWVDNYNQAWKLYEGGEFAKMVTVLEATKDQAKQKAGANSKEWGDYLTRLARAHYYAGDLSAAASYGAEAASVLEALPVPKSNKYRANWFAGVAAGENKNFMQAMPYLQRALVLSNDTDPNWDIKHGLKTLYDTIELCYQSKNDLAGVKKIQAERTARLK